MQVIRYTPKDLETLHTWLRKHETYLPPPEEMPEIGFIAKDDSDIPIAMAFLRKVEGGTAQLDGLASNPDAPSHLRHIAIDAVVTSCFQKAKELGIPHLFAFSVDVSTLTRSVKHGFVSTPYTVIVAKVPK